MSLLLCGSVVVLASNATGGLWTTVHHERPGRLVRQQYDVSFHYDVLMFGGSTTTLDAAGWPPQTWPAVCEMLTDDSGIRFTRGNWGCHRPYFGASFWNRHGFARLGDTHGRPHDSTTSWGFAIPHRLISVPAALPPLLWAGCFVRRTVRSSRRTRLGLCPRCGYDLRASADRCPECGEAVPSELIGMPN